MESTKVKIYGILNGLYKAYSWSQILYFMGGKEL